MNERIINLMRAEPALLQQRNPVAPRQERILRALGAGISLFYNNYGRINKFET